MRDQIKELLAEVDFEEFFRSRVAIKSQTGDELHGLCPFHDDTESSWSGNKTNGLWKCFACGFSGTIFQFIEKLENVEFDRAFEILREFAGSIVNLNPKLKNDKPKADRPRIDPSLPAKYCNVLCKNEKALAFLKEKKGLTLETIKKYEWGFDGTRYTIPILSQKRILRNIRLYHPGHKPKLMSWSIEEHGYGEGRIYGLDEMLARPKETVYVHEGEVDKLLSSQHGHLAVSGTVGAMTWKPAWTAFFKGRNAVILYDMDSEGRAGADLVCRALFGVAASVKNVKLPLKGTKEKNDYDDYFLKAGGTLEDLEKLIEETPPYVAPPEEKEKKVVYPYHRPVYEVEGKYQKKKWIDKEEFIYIPITNFLIIPETRIEIEGAEFLRAQVRTCQGIIHPNIQFAPESWISKPKFRRALSFLDVEFTGTDNDIQSIGGIVASKNAPQKQGVIRTGLNLIKKKWVYVEEKKAWDAEGRRDDIVYLAEDPYKVNLLDQPDLSNRELDEILGCLVAWNAPDVVYPLLGWLFACFVKERIFGISGQNPMLICWGEKGSGKSMTLTMIIRRLFGILMGTEDINIPTEFTFAKVICSSSLAPILYDEYKIGKIDLRQQKIISSMRTCVYNQRDFTRGRITLGITRWTYSAPVVIAGEMKASELAIQDRIVETYFSKKKIEEKGRTEAFEKLKRLPLGALGRDFLFWTLKLKDQEIRDLWDEQLESVDKELTGRPRENTAHARVGLGFFSQYLRSRGYKKNIHKDAFEIIDEAQKKNILEESNKTIVDTIIEALSVMAGTKIGERYILEKGIHYKVNSNLKLYLHIPSTYPLFRKWARDTDWEGERLNQLSFTKQLREAKYFKNYKSARFDIIKTVFILDLARMKHLLVEEFTEAALKAPPEGDWEEEEKGNGG